MITIDLPQEINREIELDSVTTGLKDKRKVIIKILKGHYQDGN